MKGVKEIGLIAVVVFVAAFGPGMVEHRFYYSSWESDWVQAVSASVAVIVALLLPIYRDYKNEKKLEASRKEVETIAIFATYYESLRLYEFFSATLFFLEKGEYEGLRDYLSGQDVISSYDRGRFDISSSLGSEYAEYYYKSLATGMKLSVTLSTLLNILWPDSKGEAVGARGDGPIYLMDEAFQLGAEGKEVSKKLIDETKSRSRHISLVS